MKLTPRVQANVAAIIVLLPYLVVAIFYRESVSDRTFAYLVFVSIVVSILTYRWVYHRHVSRLPVTAAPRPELALVAESMPRAVWLAAIPPIMAFVMVWWVTLYGSDLPWRDTWLAPPTPAVTHRWYRTMLLVFVVWNSLSLFMFVRALAIWHGMSRAYEFRRAVLLTAIGNQWVLLIGTTTLVCGMVFRLPVAAAVVGAIVYAASLCTAVWNGWRVPDLYAASPHTGTWFYRDSADPAFLGARGINLASVWCWVVAAAGIAPLILVQWILNRTPT